MQPTLFSSQQWTVSKLTFYIRKLLEENEVLQDVWVQGEISNLSRPASGHVYFTLKDSSAALRCVMWKTSAARLRIGLQEGMEVEVHGRIGIYEVSGQYQLYVDQIRPVGEGALYQEFMRLKAMLEAEGFHVEEAASGESALRLVQARAEPFDLVLTDLAMPRIDGRQVSETLRRYRPSVALLCMSADPDAVPYIESSDTPVRVLLKPFTPDDLYHAVRDALTRATDLAAVAEAEIVQAHAGLSKLAVALEASRTMRVQTLDLVVAARELRRAAGGQS